MAEHLDGEGTGVSTTARPDDAGPDPRVDDALQVTRTDGPRLELRAAGAVDLNSHRRWERALRRAAAVGEDVHLDLSALGFIDSRGVTALVETAARLRGDHRIVVRGAPPCMRRVMAVLWPDGVPAVDLVGDRR